MITIENLKKFGANVEEALNRCMGSETLYLNLVNRFIDQNTFPGLVDAIKKGDLEEAFHVAHSLKGVLGNLSLTPLYDVIFNMTEYLRNSTEMDYNPYIEKYQKLYAELEALKQ